MDASPGLSDGMMPGFLVEEGGMEELEIVAISISLSLLTEDLEPEVGDGFVYIFIIVFAEEFF